MARMPRMTKATRQARAMPLFLVTSAATARPRTNSSPTDGKTLTSMCRWGQDCGITCIYAPLARTSRLRSPWQCRTAPELRIQLLILRAIGAAAFAAAALYVGQQRRLRTDHLGQIAPG